MPLSDNHLEILQRHTDRLYATWPRRRPTDQALESCKLVAHRGAHNQFTTDVSSELSDEACQENTLDAFARCQMSGVWGIECDIQWSSDAVPMIIHDPDAGRVFAQPELAIARHTQAQLRSACPKIPSLQAVVERYGTQLHLMLEIKAQTWRPEHETILLDHLKELTPVVDYHLLCLDMSILNRLTRFDPACMIGVALTNTRQVFAHVMGSDFGAMSGHYVLINKRMRTRLQHDGKHVGTGFVTSRRALFRELNLGTQWIFSDHAVALQQEVARAIDTRVESRQQQKG